MQRRQFLGWTGAMLLTAGGCARLGGSRKGFELWQLPSQTPSQMMSYVICTAGARLVVIDGGTAGDAAYLRSFLLERGGRVQAWFITHPHYDHCGALGEILKDPQGLEINSLFASMPTQGWIEKVGSDDEKKTYRDFMVALDQSERTCTEVALGQRMEIDGVKIDVLGVSNPEILANPINNSSLVLRVWDQNKSVLFLADLGVEGGEKLLRNSRPGALVSDSVQMAHHGQRGVGIEVYRAAAPSECLWPTPLWLWDNDAGQGKGTGPWETLTVRGWMDSFTIRHHYLMFEGLQKVQ